MEDAGTCELTNLNFEKRKLTLTRIVLNTCDLDFFIFVNGLNIIHGIREHVLEVRIVGLGLVGLGQGRKRLVNGGSNIMFVGSGHLLIVCED